MIQIPSPSATTEPWHITLNSSDTITAISILITVLSIGFAVYQMLSAQRASERVRQARILLLKQRASQQLSTMAIKAIELYRYTRECDWTKCGEVALSLNADLANALGCPPTLISEQEVEHIRTAANLMTKYMENLPFSSEACVDSKLDTELQKTCQAVVFFVNVAAGSLQSTTIFGGDS